jgi:hypothetical protein
MRTIALVAAYFAALAFGIYQTFAPGFDSSFSRTQTERGDGMLNHYILEHSWQAVTNPNYCGSLFSPPCFFPEKSTIWYSEHLFGVAPCTGLCGLFCHTIMPTIGGKSSSIP